MQPLINIKKAPLEVAQILGNDETLIKLLYNSEPSALTDEAASVTINQLISDQYINFYAPTEYGISKTDRTAFISIFIENVSSIDKNINSSLVIYFCTKTDNILLDNNKNRLLEAEDRIWSLLEGHKLSSAGALEVSNINYVFLDDFHAGYRMRLSFKDQQNRKVDF